MKTKLLLPLLAVIAVPALAGPPAMMAPSKTTIAPPKPVYGVGWYGAIQAGINAHQNIVDDGDITLGGFRFSLEDNSEVGGFVGGKLGYVFGTGSIRPAVEFDGYYNHFEADIDFRASGAGDGNVSGDVDSGAFLVNFLIRFDLGRCQPYLGGGVGMHYSQLGDGSLRGGGSTVDIANDDVTDFAWQLIGGVDYYFTERTSLFLEYKYLNYEGTGNQVIEDRIDQHLVGLGVRVHF
ncbi:MAG: outer membrane beta-barrel protein [Chthoniobacteraceae bacterium]